MARIRFPDGSRYFFVGVADYSLADFWGKVHSFAKNFPRRRTPVFRTFPKKKSFYEVL